MVTLEEMLMRIEEENGDSISIKKWIQGIRTAMAEKKVAEFVLKQNWGIAIRTAMRGDCSEACLRKIFQNLLHYKLISLYSGQEYFEEINQDQISAESIYFFFRTCNAFRKEVHFRKELPFRRKIPIDPLPDSMFFGRSEWGDLIEIKITPKFKSLLNYDQVIPNHNFLFNKKSQTNKKYVWHVISG